MFVDKVQVFVQAGKGGNGAVSFRHEKFVDKGGPDGGDGGAGGDVVFVAEHNQSTLASFRFQPRLVAQDGIDGKKQKKRGAVGADLRVAVPVGTVVMHNGIVVADFTEEGQTQVVAMGGKGGFGNAHFLSSTRQAPRVAELGEQGQSFELVLELKSLADIGLVGLPNAGKSTFLSVVSNARPEIADYPFTTLIPNLGVADFDETSLLIADIPGLIEGASEGKGLGDEFLRHVERTRVLLHLIDGTQDDVAEAYTTIQNELASYDIDLSTKPQVVALTKIDALDDELIEYQLSEVKKVAKKGTKLITMSSTSRKGLMECLRMLRKIVETQKKTEADIEEKEASAVPILELETTEDSWTVDVLEDGSYLVSGEKIQRFAQRTDYENDFAVMRLRDIMRKLGIMHSLERKRIKPGDRIVFSGKDGSIEY